MEEDNKNLNAEEIKDQSEVNVPDETADTSAADTALNLSASTAALQEQYNKLLESSVNKSEGQVEAEETRGGLFKQITGLIKGRKSASEIRAEEEGKQGVSDIQAEINVLSPEIAALNKELKQLGADELAQTESLFGQDRGIPLAILNRREAKIQRQFAIRKMGVAADLSEKVALFEALNGRMSNAQTAVTNAVNAYTFDVQQELNDYTTLYDLNRDIIDDLDQDQKDALDAKRTALENELNERKDTLNKVGQLKIENPKAGILMTDSYEDALKKVGDYRKEHPETKQQLIGSAETGYKLVSYDEEGNVLKSTPVMAGGGGVATTPGVATYDIEVEVRADADELLGANPSEEDKQAAKDRLRRKYSPNEVSDGALDKIIGIVNESDLPPGTEDAASGWLSDTLFNRTGSTQIEEDITGLSRSGALSKADIRSALKRRGYSSEEINNSSVGNIFTSASEFVKDIGGFFTGRK